ncbi:hypothetical protein [Methanobacterium sp.]|uniref:hypothetical protein n=1 Tax=Methanobacterium sp. TaxID=2164 RepID=UPI003C710D22
MSSYEELLIKIRTASELGGFDNLGGKVKQAQTDMKAMENTTNASARKMKTDLEQVNNTNFNTLNNKFTSTVKSMVSTSASGAKAIASNLSSMTDGIDGAITSVAAGMGVMELFDKAMDKALTKTQLQNAKPQDYQKIMDQYQQFTVKSSASDDDISKILRYTYSGNSDMTYKAINSVDAISYSADKLQRQEGIRGWGTYLSGGWSAASGMMKDEPLTADQVKLLQGAQTYDERIKAMETIAAQKGNVDKFGNSLSTTVDGPLGKYNTALAAEDAIIRGATASFETLMTWIAPIISGFMALDPSVQSTIGTVLTAGIVVTAAAAGLGILVRVLSPVGSAVSGGISKLKDALGDSKDIKDKISGLKDSLDAKKLVSTVSIKAATVNVNGKTTSSTSPPTTTTSTGNGKNTPVPPVVPWWQSLTGVLSMAGVNLGVGSFAGAVKDRMNWYLPGEWGSSSSAAMTQSQMAQPATNTFGIGSLSGEGVGRTLWNMFMGGQDFGTASGNAVQTMYTQSQTPQGSGPLGAWLSGAAGNTSSWANDNIGKPLNDWWNSWSLQGTGQGIDDWFKNAHPTQDISYWANDNLGKPVNDAWNNARNTVMSNPVIGGAITQVSNLLSDPQKAWNDARTYVSHSIVGQAWADAYSLYSNVKSWWDAARNYVSSHIIKPTPGIGTGSNGGGGGAIEGAAGDEGADTGYGIGPYYEPVITTSTTKTTKQTVIHAPINIETISNREEGDRAIKAVTNHLNQFNNANGN